MEILWSTTRSSFVAEIRLRGSVLQKLKLQFALHLATVTLNRLGDHIKVGLFDGPVAKAIYSMSAYISYTPAPNSTIILYDIQMSAILEGFVNHADMLYLVCLF